MKPTPIHRYRQNNHLGTAILITIIVVVSIYIAPQVWQMILYYQHLIRLGG
jgi:hypothetical protein